MKKLNAKRLTAGLTLALLCMSAHAGIPYRNHTYEFKQPNGDVIKVVVDGNDYYAEERTADGALVVYDAAKKGLCYAEVNAAGDALVSTGVLVTNASVRSAAATGRKQPGLSNAAKAERARQRYEKLHGHTREAAKEK